MFFRPTSPPKATFTDGGGWVGKSLRPLSPLATIKSNNAKKT